MSLLDNNAIPLDNGQSEDQLLESGGENIITINPDTTESQVMTVNTLGTKNLVPEINISMGPDDLPDLESSPEVLQPITNTTKNLVDILPVEQQNDLVSNLPSELPEILEIPKVDEVPKILETPKVEPLQNVEPFGTSNINMGIPELDYVPVLPSIIDGSAKSKSNNPFILFFTIILGILFSVLIIIGFLIYQDTQISVDEIYISNITDTSATIIWRSNNSYIGNISYKEENSSNQKFLTQLQGQTNFDDRDVELNSFGNYSLTNSGSNFRKTHHITLNALKPNTKYYFRINGKLIGKEVENTNTFKTKDVKADVTIADLAFGQVELKTKSNPDAIIIITNKEGEILSSVVSKDLSYNLDLTYFTVSEALDYKIFLLTSNGKKEQNFIFETKDKYKPISLIKE